MRAAQRLERAQHRDTAANCRFWTGDRSPIDWGTCRACAVSPGPLPDSAPSTRRGIPTGAAVAIGAMVAAVLFLLLGCSS